MYNTYHIACVILSLVLTSTIHLHSLSPLTGNNFFCPSGREALTHNWARKGFKGPRDTNPPLWFRHTSYFSHVDPSFFTLGHEMEDNHPFAPSCLHDVGPRNLSQTFRYRRENYSRYKWFLLFIWRKRMDRDFVLIVLLFW